jgi:hypothetical protein
LGGLALTFNLLLSLAHAALLLSLGLALPIAFCFDLTLACCGLCFCRTSLLGFLFTLPCCHLLALAGLSSLLALRRELLFAGASCLLSTLCVKLLLALALSCNLCFAGGKFFPPLSLGFFLLAALHGLLMLAFC